MKSIAILLCLTALSQERAAAGDAIEARLAPLFGERSSCVAVYDRYAGGRPRRVIAGMEDDRDFESANQGVLLLVRLPDSDTGKYQVLNRLEIGDRPVTIDILHLIDAKDIVVTQLMPHLGGSIYRVVHDKLVKISDNLADEDSVIVDNGTPALVWSGYVGPVDRCDDNDVYAAGITKWNGRKYVDDGRHYAAFYRVIVGATTDRPSHFAAKKKKHYRLHIYDRSGVRNVQVIVDGKHVMPGPITLKPGCHEWHVHASGTPNTVAWVFLEERP